MNPPGIPNNLPKLRKPRFRENSTNPSLPSYHLNKTEDRQRNPILFNPEEVSFLPKICQNITSATMHPPGIPADPPKFRQRRPKWNETKRANEHTAVPGGASQEGCGHAARVNQGRHKRLGNGERIAHYRVVRARRGGARDFTVAAGGIKRASAGVLSLTSGKRGWRSRGFVKGRNESRENCLHRSLLRVRSLPPWGFSWRVPLSDDFHFVHPTGSIEPPPRASLTPLCRFDTVNTRVARLRKWFVRI